MVALEAFTEGVPVVCFGIPGLTDVTSIFPEGRVTPFDLDGFASRVLEFHDLWADRREEYDRLRERLQREAVERFGADVIVPKLAAMLGVEPAESE
jgi:glycosyltransferase involved in cell wall biosynthesis